MATRRSENQRASNYRKRVRDGGQLKPDEQSWLDDYEANKRKPGRPAGSGKREVSPDDLPDTAGGDTEHGAVDDKPDSEIPNNWAPPSDLPSPPRIVLDSDKRESRGDWREKYRNSEDGKMGREGTCVTVAGYWYGMLKAMEDSMQAAGIDPIVKPETLFPAMVLTVDDILPDHMELSPRVVAVGGSTALVVQRFMRREEIAKAQKKAKERADHEEWRKHRKDPVPPTDISSHPGYRAAEPSVASPAVPAESAPSEAQASSKPPEPNPHAPITIATRQAIQAAGQKDPIDDDGVW